LFSDLEVVSNSSAAGFREKKHHKFVSKISDKAITEELNDEVTVIMC